MPFYLVSMPEFCGVQRKNGVSAMIVEADSAVIAKAIAAAQFDGDSDWTAAGVTAVDLAVSTPADYADWTYRVRVGGADPGDANVADVSVVGIADDTVDLIAAELVTLLNATALIAGAAYNTSTNVLKVAETTDALGDRTLLVEVFPPGFSKPLVSMVGTVVDKGVSGAVLSAVLLAPTKIPVIVATL